ncbi:Frataxin-like protein [Pseudomonas coronafaciens pv. atropurpurea]|nr:Protein CyaY [Pseudomonas coronafaciens pv. striafaciens]RMT62343.1 Frataxin-like protein [Pseudomonas coronafaciens pv. atropurpurea]RMV86711.1 Protein CyaY [Pseudomonas coronafaciens pv. garcae]
MRPSIPTTRHLAYARGLPSSGARALMCSSDNNRRLGFAFARQRPYLARLRYQQTLIEVPVMSLTEARFHDLVDATQQNIEDVFDESGLDVDLENSAGVLTVKFEGGSQLIFSRQEPLRQLWLAAKSGGFHFDYDEDESRWACDTSDELLSEMLARMTLEQAGADLDFSPDYRPTAQAIVQQRQPCSSVALHQSVSAR